MLETARKSVAKHGLSDKITLAQGDAGAFDVGTLFGLEQVDRVFMSYTLSMMPPWKEAIALGAKALAPGGSLHIVDFGQYERLPGFAKRFHFKELNAFHVYPRADLRGVVEGVAAEQGLTASFRASLRGYTWSAGLTRPG
jgi:S-adenosylmethionine-diacylgycerolhomoserine-N-methlytransferase